MTEDFTSLLPIIAVGLVGLLVGGLVGILLAGASGASKSAKPKQSRDLVDIMRIWRDRRSGQLSLEIGGKMFKKVDEVNEKWRPGLEKLVQDLQLWLGVTKTGESIRVGTPSPAAPPPVTPAPVTPQPVTPQPETSRDYKTLPLRSLPVNPPPAFRPPVTSPSHKILFPQSPTSTEPTREVSPPSMEITDILSRVITPDSPKEVMQAPKSIATQVDEILQEKLLNSPLRNRQVRLLELAGGGMIVVVDDTQYDGVNDVPDPDVRQLLRDSVAEWERRMSQ